MNGDASTLPLIDAASLFLLRGCDCAAEVPLPDGTVPVNGLWRMEVRAWNHYRAECAADAAYMRHVRAYLAEVQRMQDIEREVCAV